MQGIYPVSYKRFVRRSNVNMQGRMGRCYTIEILKKQVSELLFERDYNTIEKVLEDYRKGEIQKKLDKVVCIL